MMLADAELSGITTDSERCIVHTQLMMLVPCSPGCSRCSASSEQAYASKYSMKKLPPRGFPLGAGEARSSTALVPRRVRSLLYSLCRRNCTRRRCSQNRRSHRLALLGCMLCYTSWELACSPRSRASNSVCYIVHHKSHPQATLICMQEHMRPLPLAQRLDPLLASSSVVAPTRRRRRCAATAPVRVRCNRCGRSHSQQCCNQNRRRCSLAIQADSHRRELEGLSSRNCSRRRRMCKQRSCKLRRSDHRQSTRRDTQPNTATVWETLYPPVLVLWKVCWTQTSHGTCRLQSYKAERQMCTEGMVHLEVIDETYPSKHVHSPVVCSQYPWPEHARPLRDTYK
jgi:hypothetical protein